MCVLIYLVAAILAALEYDKTRYIIILAGSIVGLLAIALVLLGLF